MGKPIKNKWFNSEEEQLIITCKLPGVDAAECVAVRQRGTSKYMVKHPSGELGIAYLVNKSKKVELSDGEGFILASFNGESYPIKKIVQKKVAIFCGDELIFASWDKVDIAVVEDEAEEEIVIPEPDPEEDLKDLMDDGKEELSEEADKEDEIDVLNESDDSQLDKEDEK